MPDMDSRGTPFVQIIDSRRKQENAKGKKLATTMVLMNHEWHQWPNGSRESLFYSCDPWHSLFFEELAARFGNGCDG
jgi:hypothetical protein